MPKQCRLCKQTVPDGHTHRCPKRGNAIITESDGDGGGDFLLSMAIGAATDSALLGAALGGDATGAILGDLLDGDLLD